MKTALFDFALPCLRCAVQFALIEIAGVKVARTAAGPVPACAEHFSAAGSDFGWRKSGVDVGAFAEALQRLSEDYRSGAFDKTVARPRIRILYDREFNRSRGRPLGAVTEMRAAARKGEKS